MKCKKGLEKTCNIKNIELGDCEIEDEGIVYWRCSDCEVKL